MPERLEPAASRARLEDALLLPRKGVEPWSSSEPAGSGEGVTEMQTASCTFAPLVMQQPSLLSGFWPFTEPTTVYVSRCFNRYLVLIVT